MSVFVALWAAPFIIALFFATFVLSVCIVTLIRMLWKECMREGRWKE